MYLFSLALLYTINFDAPPLTNCTQYVLTQRRQRFDDDGGNDYDDDEYWSTKNSVLRTKIILYYVRESQLLRSTQHNHDRYALAYERDLYPCLRSSVCVWLCLHTFVRLHSTLLLHLVRATCVYHNGIKRILVHLSYMCPACTVYTRQTHTYSHTHSHASIFVDMLVLCTFTDICHTNMCVRTSKVFICCRL